MGSPIIRDELPWCCGVTPTTGGCVREGAGHVGTQSFLLSAAVN